MIDSKGFRSNVGIILSNKDGAVFWGRRSGMNAWQFPQGGIKKDETPEEAMYRELYEEVGLLPEHVEIVGTTQDWLRYWLPKRFIRQKQFPLCIGQKQIWFMLRLVCDEDEVDLQASDRPEFDEWRWVSYWDPATEVVAFKRNVYRKALRELEPFLMPFIR